MNYENDINEFYKIISNIRHESAYNGSGVENNLIFEQINGEMVSDFTLARHEQNFKIFAESLVLEILNQIINLLEEITIENCTRRAIFLSTLDTFFDEIVINKFKNKEIKNSFLKLQKWLTKDVTN